MLTTASRVSVAGKPSSNAVPLTLMGAKVTVPASLMVNTNSALVGLLEVTATIVPSATMTSSGLTISPGQVHVPRIAIARSASTAHRFTPSMVPSQHGASVPSTGTSAADGRKGTRARIWTLVTPVWERADPASNHTSAATGAASVWHVARTAVPPPTTTTPQSSHVDEQFLKLALGVNVVPSGNVNVTLTSTGAPPSMVDGVLSTSGVSTAGLAVRLGDTLRDGVTVALLVQVAVGDTLWDAVSDGVPLVVGVPLKDGVPVLVAENVAVPLGLCSAVMDALGEPVALGEILLVVGETDPVGVQVVVGDPEGWALSDARGVGLALREKVGVLDLVGAGVTEGLGAGLWDNTTAGTCRGPAHSSAVVAGIWSKPLLPSVTSVATYD
jgi:hypothetical protein